MEIYRIAVGIPTLEDCLNEAMACAKHLAQKGVQALRNPGGYFYFVTTDNGIIEFIPYKQFRNLNVFTGKTYITMFNVPEYARESVKDYIIEDQTTCKCFLDWVEKRELFKKEEKTYEGLPCSNCKAFPICSAKDEFHDLQKMLNTNIEKNSKVFKEAHLVCPYYNPDVVTAAYV